MTKSRLEAFSDGVFAIAITLLILDIHLPHDVPVEQLGSALLDILPSVAIYVLTFFVIGMYWIFHHRFVHTLKIVNGKILWVNLVWILFVSVLPFPTSLVGAYPLQVLPIIIYGSNLILANVSGFFVILYVRYHPELLHEPVTAAGIKALVPVYLITNGLYALAIGLAWVAPWASYGIYLGVLLVLMRRLTKEGSARTI